MSLFRTATLCVSVVLATSIVTVSATTGQAQATKPTAAAAAQEVDPICGMTVDPAKAKDAKRTSVYEEKTFYFCSDMCKKQFDSDPAKFAAQAASGDKAAGMAGCCCMTNGAGGRMGMMKGGMGAMRGMRGNATATDTSTGGMCCRRMQ